MERGADEALFYKSMAEEKFRRSKLKSALKYARRALRLRAELEGVSEMATAFKILRCVASQSRLNYYEILGVEPFAHINSIKKRYKSLALALHPDKNSQTPGSEEAFKHVGEAFRVLSDKLLRKDFDTTLRVSMQAQSQSEAYKSPPRLASSSAATFWTACSTCRLLHQFERRYVGHRLVCPNCRKGFLAVEEEDEEEEEEATNDDLNAEGLGSVGNYKSQKDTAHLEEGGIQGVMCNSRVRASVEKKRKRERVRKLIEKKEKDKDKAEKPKRREMTLAEMQLALRRKLELSKSKSKGNKQKEGQVSYGKASVTARHHVGHPMCMTVEDSDFYDFDKDRMERSLKKGYVWALYDDDDGMPRHYGLIREVYSLHPFSVKISWLDVQSNSGGTAIDCWGDQLGLVRVSCGRFQAGRMHEIESINMFSHVVNCERAAKEFYRIYPKKGSVWALYDGKSSKDGELVGSGTSFEERSYEIVVLLTSYSEMHGLSVAYLEKVEGFKTIFQRREIGIQAITWFEKDNVSSFSHQIPARKLSGEEAPNLPKECWELDPASLPPDLLRIYN